MALFSLTLIRIEKAGYSHASMARCVYSHTPKGLVRASLNGALPEMLEPYENLGFFNISKSPPHNGLVIGEAVKFSTIDLWVRTEELRRFQKEGSSHVRSDPPMSDIQEKPIGPTERNKMLAIIAALCQEADIDVKAHGAVAEIARLTELLGAAVSADTVGRRLKEIPAALESFKT